jgi:hypothetical protein
MFSGESNKNLKELEELVRSFTSSSLDRDAITYAQTFFAIVKELKNAINDDKIDMDRIEYAQKNFTLQQNLVTGSSRHNNKMLLTIINKAKKIMAALLADPENNFIIRLQIFEVKINELANLIFYQTALGKYAEIFAAAIAQVEAYGKSEIKKISPKDSSLFNYFFKRKRSNKVADISMQPRLSSEISKEINSVKKLLLKTDKLIKEISSEDLNDLQQHIYEVIKDFNASIMALDQKGILTKNTMNIFNTASHEASKYFSKATKIHTGIGKKIESIIDSHAKDKAKEFYSSPLGEYFTIFSHLSMLSKNKPKTKLAPRFSKAIMLNNEITKTRLKTYDSESRLSDNELKIAEKIKRLDLKRMTITEVLAVVLNDNSFQDFIDRIEDDIKLLVKSNTEIFTPSSHQRRYTV